MAIQIVQTVIDALNEAGIPAQQAYPGSAMARISEAHAAVNLEKLEYTARSATVLVTVMAPADLGGSVCEEQAVEAGGILEGLGGICTQEECKFNGYADAYYVRVLGTFYGADVISGWNTVSDFKVTVGTQEAENVVAFKAEQAVDEVTGTPLSTSVWTFRLEEKFGRGEGPLPSPTEPFSITVVRSGSTEIYNECTWISVQLENTDTGLRQIRTGVAASRSFLVVA